MINLPVLKPSVDAKRKSSTSQRGSPCLSVYELRLILEAILTLKEAPEGEVNHPFLLSKETKRGSNCKRKETFVSNPPKIQNYSLLRGWVKFRG